MQKYRHKILRNALLFTLVGSLCLSPDKVLAQRSESPIPIHKERIVEALRENRLSARELLREIERSGVTFRITPKDEQELRRAGASSELIKAIRSNYLIVVLLGRFEGPDPDLYRVTDIVRAKLGEALAKIAEARVLYYNRPISASKDTEISLDEREVGRKIARQHNANIFVWGWYSRTKDNVIVNSHFQIMSKPIGLSLLDDFREHDIVRKEAADLDGFDLQFQLSSEMNYLTLLTIGLIRYDARDLSGSIDRFNQALTQIAPAQIINPGVIYFYRGSSVQLIGQPELAIRDYEKALQLGLRGSAIHNNLGNAYDSIGAPGKAIAEYNKAVDSNPNNAMPYYNLGRLESHHGHYKEAIPKYDKAISLDPNYINAYYGRGNAYAKTGNFRSAIADYANALERYPNASEHNPMSQYTLLNARGLANTSAEKFDDAFHDLNVAIRLDPKQYDAYWNLGIFYLHNRNPKKDKKVGLEYLKKARELADDPETLPKDADILRRLRVE